MANRKKAIQERKSMRFTFRLSPNDYNILLSQSMNNNMGIADYIRTSALYCAHDKIEFIHVLMDATKITQQIADNQKPLKKAIKSNKK